MRRSGRPATTTTLERFEIQTPFLTADGQGDLDRGIVVTAAVDLAVFRERFRDWIDLGGVVLAGKGKLSASYRRQGETFDAQGDRRAPRPAPRRAADDRADRARTGHARRERRGGPPASGWPRDWRNLTLEASSDQAEGKIVATNDPAAGAWA